MPVKYDNEMFIKRAKEVHKNKYNYSKTVYKNNKISVIIKCSEGHVFSQKPHNHLSGNGCPVCNLFKKRNKRNKRSLTDINQMLQKAKLIYNDKYDYSKVNYTGCKKPIIIICKIHGEFNEFISKHVNKKKECPECHKYNKKNTNNHIVNIIPKLSIDNLNLMSCLDKEYQYIINSKKYMPLSYDIPSNQNYISLYNDDNINKMYSYIENYIDDINMKEIVKDINYDDI